MAPRIPSKENRVVLRSAVKLPLSSAKTGKIIRSILSFLKFEGCEADFHFVSDREMKVFNRKFKHRDRRTDVLAFSQVEGKPFPVRGPRLLGDVIISADAAWRQAPAFGNSVEKEFVLYLIHGLLHLLGYDDIRPSARKAMRAKEEELLICVRKKYRLWPSTKPKR